MVTINNARDLSVLVSLFETLSVNDVVFLDVDDTLITPVDAIFRDFNGKNSYARFIDGLKEKYLSGDQSVEPLLGNWRLQRKVQLVDPQWPQVIQRLQEQGALVYGLTKMDVGKFGPIASVESWRVQELRDLALVFTQQYEGRLAFSMDMPKKIDSPSPVFKQGIFLTSGYSKAELLEWILDTSASINKIVIVDDRLEQLQAIANIITNRPFDLYLYHYQAAKELQGNYDPTLFQWQIDRLMQELHWYSDQEALIARSQ